MREQESAVEVVTDIGEERDVIAEAAEPQRDIRRGTAGCVTVRTAGRADDVDESLTDDETAHDPDSMRADSTGDPKASPAGIGRESRKVAEWSRFMSAPPGSVWSWTGTSLIQTSERSSMELRHASSPHDRANAWSVTSSGRCASSAAASSTPSL